MNVLERIECDSSAESDVSEAEYDFSKASDDCDCCELSHELDTVPSSSSSSTSRSASLEGVSNLQSLSTSSGVSLLSVLKAPTPSDLSRKRKIARNLKKRVKSTNSQSNSKTVKPQKRVNEFPKEPFTVESGKLFCLGCREELPLKKSSIEYHIKSGKHGDGKKRLEKKKANDQNIVQSLKKYNEEVHGRGETLPEQQQVFRVKVVKTFLQAGVPTIK